MLIKCIKRIRNSPRIDKIKDKATDIAVWTPILLLVYVNVALLTYRYSRDDSVSDSILD